MWNSSKEDTKEKNEIESVRLDTERNNNIISVPELVQKTCKEEENVPGQEKVPGIK